MNSPLARGALRERVELRELRVEKATGPLAPKSPFHFLLSRAAVGRPKKSEPKPMDADLTLVQDQTEIERATELSLRVETPPASVPGYAMIRSLGEGAFGSVWLACEENTGKQVAIKFYSHQRGLD